MLARLAFLLIVLLLSPVAGAGCATTPAPAVYQPRASYPIVLGRLRQRGHRPDEVVRLLFPSMVDNLVVGRPYRFVVTVRGEVVIAPWPGLHAANPFRHVVLAAGQPVRTAGSLTLAVAPFTERGVVRPAPRRKVVVDQRSGAYCPSYQSLEEARRALVAIGLAADEVELRNQPPDRCLPATPAAGGSPR